MELKASQLLVDLILKYSFVEKTASKYPKHFNLLKDTGKYNPYSVKRYFTKGRMKILLDYPRIILSYNSQTFFDNYTITVLEFISLIYFTSLSSSQKQYFLRGNDYDSILKVYEDLRERMLYLEYKNDRSHDILFHHLNELDKLNQTLFWPSEN